MMTVTPLWATRLPTVNRRASTICSPGKPGSLSATKRLLVDADGFAEAVAAFLIAGGKGLNVTVPFKQQAYEIADELSPRAQRAAAVNTLLIRDEGALFGDNTDGVGLVRDLTRNLKLTLSGKQILLLGAGGAARGVLAPLLEQKPSRLLIANRTAERAEQLADSFCDIAEVAGCGFDVPVRLQL